MRSLIDFAVQKPRVVGRFWLWSALVMVLVVALPSIWPTVFSSMHPLHVDTDPENMLSEDEAVRVFHHRMKHDFFLNDMIVLGVINETHADGVFNPQSLRNIYELTEFVRTLSGPDENNASKIKGVVEADMIAPSAVDNIEHGGPGMVIFDWLMGEPPETAADALTVREKALRIPFLNGTLLSEDGQAIALYLPITAKDLSYGIASKLREKIATLTGDDRYYITGLPIAEDQFGVEMFIQMAVCAPLAMIVICLLMYYFFRRWALVASSMGVAMVAVIGAMGFLIASGHTVHIMSSMIPIFIMPIAVLDAIHVLSEFFDRYQETRDRRATIVKVVNTLYTPMLFTSLTTAAGFASLALTPIPPVQVFGLFTAFGIMVAWVATITLIPAVVMFMREESLADYGLVFNSDGTASASPLTRLLAWTGRFTYRRAAVILISVVGLCVLVVPGITRIQINDNPVKWFAPSHEIRIADRELNQHFGGTYMAHLALRAQSAPQTVYQYADELLPRLSAYMSTHTPVGTAGAAAITTLEPLVESIIANGAADKNALLNALESYANTEAVQSPHLISVWETLLLFVDEERQRDQIFKDPDMLRFLDRLQVHMAADPQVGKTNSVADIVKTMYRELHTGDADYYRIPDSSDAVAQTMLTFESGHRPQDLWRFITPDYRNANIWVQLKSGDNKDMSEVVASVDEFFAANPSPHSLSHDWFGLNYINVIWQGKMVNGMVYALLGSFLMVLLMMAVLFRSLAWGLLCMIPLSVAIASIYALIGYIGKDYDMPIAVLSALSLGLAVDYAIHFITRSRKICEQYGISWQDTLTRMFKEPARAITRNVIVNGVGFLPLLAAPLVPYQTVGVFIAAILVTAGIATLVILPALITVLQRFLFPQPVVAGVEEAGAA